MVNVFVYGTLKPGEAYYDTFCAAHVVESIPALTTGILFHLPQGYPALTPEAVAPPTASGWVWGALLQFRQQAAIAALDDFEGYDPTRPDPDNVYVRRWRSVFTPEQHPLGAAWMYVMSLERVRQAGGVLVPSGCWSQQQWPSISPTGA